VLTQAGSTAASYLKAHAITPTTVTAIDQAFTQLDQGKADAIVFDAPVLQHRVTAFPTGSETLVGGVFARQDYGIAVPTGSALRKKINVSLLEMRADGTYDRIYEHYFGQQSG
jgi:polar amino acid transport system substrate-binding protein